MLLAEVFSAKAIQVASGADEPDLTPDDRADLVRLLRWVDNAGLADVDYRGDEDGVERRDVILKYLAHKTSPTGIPFLRATAIVRSL